MDIENPFELVDNPEHVWAEDKEFFEEFEPIIIELLDELKSNGKINKFVPLEKRRLHSVMDNIYQIQKNHNWLIDISYSAEKEKSFLALNSNFGLNRGMFTYFSLQFSILSSTAHFEMFKNFLLFHLINVDYRASQFNKTIESSAPKAWQKLKPYIDNDLRNSLAHGTWIIENGKVILFKDSALISVSKEMPIKDFILDIKKQNIMYIILVHALAKKHREGFFK